VTNRRSRRNISVSIAAAEESGAVIALPTNLLPLLQTISMPPLLPPGLTMHIGVNIPLHTFKDYSMFKV